MIGVFGVLAVVIGIVIMIHVVRSLIYPFYGATFNEWVSATICGLILGSITFLIIACIGFIPHHIWGEKTIENHNIEIVSVHNQSGITRQAAVFLVFSCQIKDVDYFSFYHKSTEHKDAYEKGKIITDKTIIHESDGIPRLEYKMENKNSKIWVGKYTSSQLMGKYHLYVPKGSIYKEFTVK